MEQIHGGNIYDLAKEGKELLDFSANINPLGMPYGIKKAVESALNDSSRYPDIKSRQLIEKISEYEKLSASCIAVGNGAADLIYALCLSQRFKKALIMSPGFSEYEKALRASESKVEYLTLKAEEGFELKNHHLDLIDSSVDAIFLCQPNNPTGILTDGQMLRNIFCKCRENNVFIVADECFLEFVEKPEVYSLKSYINEGNVFILKSFTKLYAIAGIRLGYCICCNEKVIDKLNYFRQSWPVSNLAQSAGIAAFKEKEFVSSSLEYIKKEKQYLLESFEALGLKVYGSAANYLFFLSNEHKLYEKLIERGILIRSCKSYNVIPVGFYRIAIKSHRENERLIKELFDILKGGKNGKSAYDSRNNV